MASLAARLGKSCYSIMAGFVCLCCLIGNAQVKTADTRVFSEYELKAAFLYKLALFVEWPESSFPHARSPLLIGILGKDPFGPHLRKAVEGKRISNRSIVLKACRDVGEAKDCHLLFISSTEKPNLPQILGDLQRLGVLTVGDVEDFATLGGIINLVAAERTVRFQINPDAAQRAGLKISSQMLELAQIVRDANPPAPR